jgi:GNAT superfamily N-acetyltransferase
MVDVARGPFDVPRVDRFEEWLHAPVPLESTHPRFDIRRARPAEFNAIYELVDRGFGLQRLPPVYDWLYRRNPCGTARCWVVIDRASGRLVGSTASWPWPLARATQALEGTLDGDTVVAPEWQRQGIDALRAAVVRSHPWQATVIGLSWPNEKSRAAAAKRGRAWRILGPVPRAVMLLNTRAFLAGRSWPAPASAGAGMVADGILEVWRRVVLPAERDLAVEEVRHFDSAFDVVTQRYMAWHGFWSPHDAAFLNWRYFADPAGQYVAFALAVGAELAGYYVLKIEEAAGWLMEFVAPCSPRGHAGALLLHVIKTARAAGCAYLRFSASPTWRHWKMFRAAGFLRIGSGVCLWPAGEVPDLRQLNMWQWVPGDMDNP